MESQSVFKIKDVSSSTCSSYSETDKVGSIADKTERDIFNLPLDDYAAQLHRRKPRWEKTLILFKAVMMGLVIFSVTKVVLNTGSSLWTSSLSQGRLLNKIGGCTNQEKEFKWSDITPSKELIYTSCFDGHQCARLDVPMDWNSSDPNGERVAVAIVKLPAKVDVTDERYGGIIVTNPGGPGGSGVGDLLRRGGNIQKIADAIKSPDSLESSSKTSRYFDILSFDPRGINKTTPHISCFNSNFERQRWLTSIEATGTFGSSNVAFGELYSRGIALSETCSQQNSSLLYHMTTASVVADIVEILEAHGRWREKKVKASFKDRTSKGFMERSESNDAVLARTAYKKGEEKLQYWGFSYGTLLGSTFASLQPHRVHRVIIDGVVNATDYYSGLWLTNLQDTDQIIYKFGDYCHEAGPEKCALWRERPALVLQELESILDFVWDDPIPVIGNEVRGVDIITYSDVMGLIRLGLYNPIKHAQRIATFVRELSVRNGTGFANHKADVAKPDCEDWSGQPNDPDVCAPTFDPPVSAGIACSDAVDLTNKTRADFAKQLEVLRGQSKWLGNMWGEISLNCFAWKSRPIWRFDREVGSITNHPILLIGNTYDAVTPLRNAITVSEHFPGSVVLTQDSEGHCSSAAPSICTAKHVRQYFQTGVLPDRNTICEAEERMFFSTDAGALEAMSVDDKELLKALKANTAVW